jgi:hypothetical protein
MNYDPIKKFLSRTKGAVASKSKELRMPTDEAQELSVALAELLALALAGAEKTPNMEISVNMDGGKITRK